jgi:hypothetical protein
MNDESTVSLNDVEKLFVAIRQYLDIRQGPQWTSRQPQKLRPWSWLHLRAFLGASRCRSEEMGGFARDLRHQHCGKSIC